MRLVLLHGLLTDHRLWRKVVPLLDGIETVTPTLPLGSHTTPVPPGTDLSPPGLARLVADQHLLAAVPRLREFDKPVTLAWAREDRLVFPPSIAERLAGDFPRARIEWIDDSLTFVPEDRPDALAAILRAAAGVSSQ